MFLRVVNVTRRLDFSDAFALLESNPIVSEAGGLQSQGAKGAAVARTTASPKGSRKNKITFYPSRLQVIFARSGDGKILERACYSCGFATPGSNKSNPNPGA
jgi:hypothetical protein